MTAVTAAHSNPKLIQQQQQQLGPLLFPALNRCCLIVLPFVAFQTDNFFVVADAVLKSIFHVDYATGFTTQLLSYDRRAQPFAVAYDPTTKLVYWSDHGFNTISRYSLLHRNQSTLYEDGQCDLFLCSNYFIHIF